MLKLSGYFCQDRSIQLQQNMKRKFLKKSLPNLKEGIFSTYLVKYVLLQRCDIKEIFRKKLLKDLIETTEFLISSSIFKRL